METTPPARPAAPAPDLRVEGCTALVHGLSGDDGPDGIGFAEDVDVEVSGGLITRVGPARDRSEPRGAPPPAEVLDGRGLLAVPGLVNCHTHAAMVLFRGAAEDVDVHTWFNGRIWPMESNLTERDVELGALLACAEMLLGGTTTFADHYFHMDAVARAVEVSGVRADLGWASFSSDGPAGRERGLDFALRQRGAAAGRITTSLAPHAPYTVTEPDLAVVAEQAREHHLPVHLHAAETLEQTRASLERTGATPVQVLARTGLLDVEVLVAHGTGVVEADLPLLAQAAERGLVGVASSPRFYLKAAHGTTPIRALTSAGVPVGLATDGAASNGDLDLWASLEVTSLVQKSLGGEGDPTWMTSRQVLHHATTQSAQALHLADPRSSRGAVGRLAPGFRADVALLDLSAPHLQPVHDLAATLVHATRPGDVRHVVVDGRVVVRDRRVLTVDVPAVLEELRPRLAALTRRDVGRIQTYRP
ncbi:amidohydrolase [Quadrisphaera setariae]|uniref:Amidohydrolase n=1 Tax=Quadrisphaera setariae TaxID=2593304 RepID=A0A5C8ZJ81_9ACTN|nr:amidohydrolase [Quadrisphaera setariae]TXR57952.1 amidohydrolase [Quadrisphaera setariae]